MRLVSFSLNLCKGSTDGAEGSGIENRTLAMAGAGATVGEPRASSITGTGGPKLKLGASVTVGCIKLGFNSRASRAVEKLICQLIVGLKVV